MARRALEKRWLDDDFLGSCVRTFPLSPLSDPLHNAQLRGGLSLWQPLSPNSFCHLEPPQNINLNISGTNPLLLLSHSPFSSFFHIALSQLLIPHLPNDTSSQNQREIYRERISNLADLLDSRRPTAKTEIANPGICRYFHSRFD